MASNAASFVGNIPDHYDRGLGPVVFAATDLNPPMVEGTGIVTRQLRDVLPANAQLTQRAESSNRAKS